MVNAEGGGEEDMVPALIGLPLFDVTRPNRLLSPLARPFPTSSPIYADLLRGSPTQRALPEPWTPGFGMLGATFSPVRVQSPLVTYTPVARCQLYVEPQTPVLSEPPTPPHVETPVVYPIILPPAECADEREDLSEDDAPAEVPAAPLRNAIRSPYVHSPVRRRRRKQTPVRRRPRQPALPGNLHQYVHAPLPPEPEGDSDEEVIPAFIAAQPIPQVQAREAEAGAAVAPVEVVEEEPAEERVHGAAHAAVWPVPAPAAVNLNNQPEEAWTKTGFVEGKGGSQILQAGGYKFYKNGIKVRAGDRRVRNFFCANYKTTKCTAKVRSFVI